MTRLKLALRRYGRHAVALGVLMVIGSACLVLILLGERLQNPFASFYTVNAAFPTAAAVTPGLGEPVQVAGVRVGQITDVTLAQGRGVLKMSIDPRKLPRVYNDAHATLVPNSPLKDMQVDLDPGDASAGRLENGGTIPVAQTTSPIDSDELTAALDADSRTWLRSLIADLDTGTSGRGRDLRRLLGLLGPTAAQMRRLGDVLAARRHALARVVHNLGAITAAVAGHDAQLDAVVSAGDRTLHALAVQDVALRDAVTRLPSTLQVATATLTDLTGFSGQLGPTARALLPTARRLPQVLRDTQTLFQGAALLPLKQTPAFVAAVLPLARLIAPTTHDIGAQLPSLIRSFDVLSYVSNEIAYDSGPHPGFLYWLAWAAHDLNSFVSTQDADGGLWRLLTLFSCSNVQQNPLAGALAGILAVNQSTCP